MKYIAGVIVVLAALFMGINQPDDTFACYPSLTPELKPTWVWCGLEEGHEQPDSETPSTGEISNESETPPKEENQQVLFA